MWKSFAIAVQLVGLAACATTQGADPLQQALVRELSALAGPNAKGCGVVPLEHDASASWPCAQAQEEAGSPYWFAVQLRGIDSQVWIAAVRTPQGERHLAVFDSNPGGGPGLAPRLTSRVCLGTIELAGPSDGLYCTSHEP
jgi:hypothetical protein